MNRYEMLDRVGDGAFGEVSRARSVKTHEIVAVKKIKALFPTWEECLQLRELKSLRVLRHENIVLLKEVIRDKEELYFVFDRRKFRYLLWSLLVIGLVAVPCHRDESGQPKSDTKHTHGTKNGALRLSVLVAR
ncbi:hypothetical protein KRP22_010915 [Phytophthora ramorum]|nr:Serine/threonine-protein kinase ICK [Phytophthora ramorum]